MRLTQYVEHWATVTPHATALSAGDVELSYATVARLVADGAARLQGIGVRPGDRVAIAGVNTPGWVVAFLATLRSGAVAVPLNSRLGAQQVPELLADIEPVLVLVDDTQRENFVGVADQLGRRLVSFGDGEPNALRALPVTAGVFDDVELGEDAPALLSFTSGTTSTPKGALISHGSVLATARSWLPYSKAQPGAVTTVLVPLFHNTAYIDQIAHMIVAGGHVDLVARYRTEAAVAAMTRRPPTFIVSVPSIVRMLMLDAAADRIFEACTTAGVGGSQMPVAWTRELVARWPHVELMHGYGLTEFTSLSHVLPGSEILEHGDSVGYPVPGVRCEIRDEQDRPVPPGVAGEVWLAGPQRMLGYWRNKEANARALAGEWLRTGDRGTVDGQGRLRILGRMDAMINRGGEKISPALVEEALSEDPALAAVAVFGLPDEFLGERVAAAVVPWPGASFDPVQSRQTIGRRLPDYAWPVEFLLLDELPLAATGKTDRQRLVALAAEEKEYTHELPHRR